MIAFMTVQQGLKLFVRNQAYQLGKYITTNIHKIDYQ